MAEEFDVDIIEGIKIPSLVNTKIDNDRFQLVKRIGTGGYSTVYLAKDLLARPGSRDPTHVAIKCVLHHRRLKLEREVALHERASAHVPGVVKIYKSFEEGGLFFIVLEHCPHGDLFSVITETHLFIGNDELIKTVFLQLLDIVAALHRKSISHRDLKPENILCLNSPQSVAEGQSSMIHVLLGDFGLATEAGKSLTFGCGSNYYMTPECLAGVDRTGVEAYSCPATDIWALGIILINLVCGRTPWKAAVPSDTSFARFEQDHTWLRQMLPISIPAYEFLAEIFVNHGNNLDLSDLRKQFCEIETFYMTDDELAVADNTARLVASELIPIVGLENIYAEDIMDCIDFDDGQLFDDDEHAVHDDNETDAELKLTHHSSAGRTPFASAGAHDGPDSSPECAGPITPETNASQAPEGVPKLTEERDPVGDNEPFDWDSTLKELRAFNRLFAAQAIQTSPLVGRFVL